MDEIWCVCVYCMGLRQERQWLSEVAGSGVMSQIEHTSRLHEVEARLRPHLKRVGR